MAILAGIVYVQCEACHSWTTPGFQIHYCVRREAGKLVSEMKRWNHHLGVWQVDLPRAKLLGPGDDSKGNFKGLETYNVKTGQWDKEDSKAAGAAEADEGYEVSTCEIPTKVVGKDEKTVTPNVSPTHRWEPAKPWEGVDRNRWPETWMKLVQIYFAKDYYGKYIDNEVYRDRILRGIYKPEPKPYSAYPSGYTGNGYHGEWSAYGPNGPGNGKTTEADAEHDPGDEAGNPYNQYWHGVD